MYLSSNTGNEVLDRAINTLNHPSGEEYPGANDWAREVLRAHGYNDISTYNSKLLAVRQTSQPMLPKGTPRPRRRRNMTPTIHFKGDDDNDMVFAVNNRVMSIATMNENELMIAKQASQEGLRHIDNQIRESAAKLVDDPTVGEQVFPVLASLAERQRKQEERVRAVINELRHRETKTVERRELRG